MMKGSITVFLALTLSVLTGFLLFLTENAISNAEKIRLEGAMDLGMKSILGEFHRGLHDRYGLFFIDLSYQAGEPSLDRLEARLDFYIRQNLQQEKNGPWGMPVLEQMKIGQITSAAFENGNAMKYQAVCYLQDCNQREMANGKNWFRVGKMESGNVMEAWSSLMGEISGMELPLIQNERGEWEEVSLENPADAAFALAGSDVLELLGVDISSIYVGKIQKEIYASQRSLQYTGYGERKEADTELFIAYLFEKMGNYRRLREDSFLQYQLEYVAMGKCSDYENLQSVAENLLQWCFARNVEYVRGSTDLQSRALERAGELPAVRLKESFRRPVAESMLYALAYLESLAEVRCLFWGGRIMQEKDILFTSWEQMEAATILQLESNYEGLCYEDFLAAMLMQLSEEVRNLRSMAIMEMDIRMLDHNPNFSMDFCVERIDAEVKSGSYSIRRTYGYY